MQIENVQFNADLSEILSELQSQLRANNIPLLQKTKDVSGDIMIQCPYHGNGQERRPSAGISKTTGMFHCFACNEVHTLPEVISYCFGHYEDAFGSFGWKWLNKNFATIAKEERKDVCLDFGRHNGSGNNRNIATSDNSNTANYSSSKDRRESNQYVLKEELERYRYTHPYWKKRGITDENIIELFDLGYDKKTDCITFPVRNIAGDCLFVARRSVKTKFFNYPTGVEKPLYGLYEIFQDLKNIENEYDCLDYEVHPDEIIVCESMLDALTAWQYGKYAVALNGLGNELQFKQLRKLPCRKLILATDNDSAGLRARKRIRKNVTNKIITEYQFPEGKKDLNELSFSEFQALEEVF